MCWFTHQSRTTGTFYENTVPVTLQTVCMTGWVVHTQCIHEDKTQARGQVWHCPGKIRGYFRIAFEERVAHILWMRGSSKAYLNYTFSRWAFFPQKCENTVISYLRSKNMYVHSNCRTIRSFFTLALCYNFCMQRQDGLCLAKQRKGRDKKCIHLSLPQKRKKEQP